MDLDARYKNRAVDRFTLLLHRLYCNCDNFDYNCEGDNYGEIFISKIIDSACISYGLGVNEDTIIQYINVLILVSGCDINKLIEYVEKKDSELFKRYVVSDAKFILLKDILDRKKMVADLEVSKESIIMRKINSDTSYDVLNKITKTEKNNDNIGILLDKISELFDAYYTIYTNIIHMEKIKSGKIQMDDLSENEKTIINATYKCLKINSGELQFNDLTEIEKKIINTLYRNQNYNIFDNGHKIKLMNLVKDCIIDIFKYKILISKNKKEVQKNLNIFCIKATKSSYLQSINFGILYNIINGKIFTYTLDMI